MPVPAERPLLAQDAPRDTTLPPETEPIDVKVLRTVYDVEAVPFELTMRGVNASAYPIYLGAAPALLAGTSLTDSDTRPVLLLAASQFANFGTTFALKNIVQRPRPYAALSLNQLGCVSLARRPVGKISLTAVRPAIEIGHGCVWVLRGLFALLGEIDKLEFNGSLLGDLVGIHGKDR